MKILKTIKSISDKWRPFTDLQTILKPQKIKSRPKYAEIMNQSVKKVEIPLLGPKKKNGCNYKNINSTAKCYTSKCSPCFVESVKKILKKGIWGKFPILEISTLNPICLIIQFG